RCRWHVCCLCRGPVCKARGQLCSKVLQFVVQDRAMSETSDNTGVSVVESPQQREVAAGLSSGGVVLKARKAQPFFGRHPWVLDTAVVAVDGAAADGDI